VAPKLALADFLSITPLSFTISPSRATAQLSLQHEKQLVPLLKLRTFSNDAGCLHRAHWFKPHSGV
jgi:hypothetical protein